jgi:hypothetical protein
MINTSSTNPVSFRKVSMVQSHSPCFFILPEIASFVPAAARLFGEDPDRLR